MWMVPECVPSHDANAHNGNVNMSDYPDPAPNVNEEAKPKEVVLTREGLLAFAIQLHREGRLEAAESCYETFLRMEPGNANALHYLGVVLRQRGEGVRSLELIRQSIAIDPTVASWHNNLGNALLQEGAFDDAAAAYARCSELDPGNLEVLNIRSNPAPELPEGLLRDQVRLKTIVIIGAGLRHLPDDFLAYRPKRPG